MTDGGGLSDTSTQEVTVNEPPPPPPNQPPVASFTLACTSLTCSFTDTSTDDGGVVAWFWDFGDGDFSGERHPMHTYGAEGTYTVGLLVEDADQSLDLAVQDVTIVELPPDLSASQLKIKGELVVDLTWSGTVKPVDLYRNGALIVAGVSSASPTYRDFTGQRGKATFVYRACIAGTTKCSPEVTVVF